MLRVWLPLNGTVENIGCSGITVTNNGATVNTNGKIGSCYSFNGSSNYMMAPYAAANYIKNISFCCWVKLNNITANMTLISSRKGTGYGLSIFILAGRIRFDNGPDNSTSQTLFSTSLTANVWQHICVIQNANNRQLYIDGVLKETVSATAPNTNTAQYLLIGGSSTGDTTPNSNWLNGYLNDFRIYDHALSAAEVREISQGLVLHYKLDDPYSEASTFLSCIINNTAYNASIGKYNYNETSNLQKTTGVFQGKQCVKISTITAGVTAQPYSYFSNLFTSNGTNSPAYKALSFDYFTTCPTTTWLNIYKLGSGTGTATWKTTSTSKGIRTGTYTNSSNSIQVEPNEWNHVEVILHGTTDADAQWGYCVNGPAHTTSIDYYFLYANIQLEQNDHITGYGAGLHNSIIQDSSGFNYNGTTINAPKITTDTPRYSYSTNFPENADGIACENFPLALQNGPFTYSFWIKPSGENGARSIYCASYSGTSCSLEKTTGNKLRVYWASYPDLSTTNLTITDGSWQHIAVVKSEDKTKVYCYYNGVLKDTLSSTLSDKTFSGTMRIGRDSRGDATSYCGLMSDFRFYATALDADAIRQLYEMGAKVDNKQNFHTYELNEFGSNQITKTGILKDTIVEPFLELPDGSKWQLMLYHYVDGGNNLFTSNNATYCNDLGLYSRLLYINDFTYDNKYEFYVIQDGMEFRWTQTSQPTASSITGLTTVSGYTNPYHGLAKASQNYTYIGYGSWWGACGCWTSYTTGGKKGIPGFGPASADGICTKYLALYARVSSYNFKVANLNAYANEFVEL